jgi:SAM-dependent methyltransferase
MGTISSGFHLADGNGYMLDKGYAAACRLNLQFYLWKNSLTFNLHPSILIPHPQPSSPLRIADLACGTGIWLLDLARELPEPTVLDGFDIDLSKAPPAQWLPDNVTVYNWDILSPVPEHLVGRYDIVHLRLLILVVEHSDPVPIIQNAYRMLKPGGYIQWDDLNYPDTHIIKADANTDTPAFDRLLHFVRSNGRHDWVLSLPGILEKNGFTDARLDHYRDRTELVMANGQQHLMTMEEFAGSLQRKGMLEEARNIHQLIADCCREASQGVALSMPRVVCVARKAHSCSV